MKPFLDKSLTAKYKSTSQQTRIITESWVNEEIFCPSCGADITQYERNRPVADFYCSVCHEEYELKSKKNNIGPKIVNGAYNTILKRLNSHNNPNFFLLSYDPQNYQVLNFFVVPKYFFVPSIIEKRNPLSQNARRAGWVGCNIILKNIPQLGKIYYIKNRTILPKPTVMETWRRTLFLNEETKVTERGWTLDIVNCIESINKNEFSLSEVYNFEKILQVKHPRNLHIKNKIRQQLQILRDSGYLEFLGKGKYRLI